MANVRAIKTGYYNHRRVKAGEVFDMKEVDKDGYYLDADGKRAKFKLRDRKGEETKETKERKCAWVENENHRVVIEVNPFEVAQTLSGKFPGKK
jgi:hypothetical protein